MTRLSVTNHIFNMCAKSKSFFGLRRGSTKSLTFQVLDGVQITKDRVTEVRNPRTEKQRIQRVLMNTALRAYSHMQAICNHSFEGISYGGKTQQAFIAENIRAVRQRLSEVGESYKLEKSFTPIGKTFVAPNAYIISRGSLPELQYSMGNGLTMNAGTTYAEVISAAKAQPGDQLTICLLVGDNKPSNTSFAFCRIILQPQDASGANLPLSTPFLDGAVVNMPNLKNENTDLFVFAMNEGQLTINYTGQQVHAGGIILSRQVNNVWLRSPQTMVYKSPKIGYNLADAVSSSTSDIAVNDPYYLNNAGDGESTPVAGVSSVIYNNAILASGAILESGHSLVVNGSALGNANVELYNGSQKYVQAAATDTKITYTLSVTGNYTLYVNGQVYATFTIANAEDIPNFSNVKFGGVSYPNGANVSVPANSTQVLTMSVVSGVSASDIVASNENITISGAGISGGVYTANVKVGASGTITLRGAVVVAIAMQSDDHEADL